MLTTFRYRAFARLFTASLISEIGSKIHRIALLVLVYSLTQQALWVSLTLAVQLLASIVIGPLLAPWADTQDRKQLLIISDLGRAGLVALIPLAGQFSLPLLLTLVCVIEILRMLHDPVAQAIVPDLLPAEALDEANGLMLFSQRFAEVTFVGIAGALVALVGATPAFWIDAGTYLISAAILVGLPRFEAATIERSPYWARVRAGGDHLWHNRPIRITIATLVSAAVFGSVEMVLGIVLAVTILGVGSAGFGIMEAAMALGAIAGTLVVPRLAARMSRERLFLGGLALFGLLIASIGVVPVFSWVVVAYLLSGIVNMCFIVPLRSIVQLNTPPELRTRVFTAVGAVANGGVLTGTLLCGVAAPVLGAPAVFTIAGLLVAAVAAGVVARGGIPSATPAPEPPMTVELSNVV